MVNKETLITKIEQELVQAEQAQNDHAFEKHMYAIHILTSLYAATSNTSYIGERPLNYRFANQNQVSQSQRTQPTHQVTAAEIEAMGGKVSTQQSQSKQYTQNTTQQQRLATDDDIGNGESIFDF
ncbi:YwdI family protein [Staphylococcus roterodami]|nr:YwdI family protein [Staphylococcus roterodami]